MILTNTSNRHHETATHGDEIGGDDDDDSDDGDDGDSDDGDDGDCDGAVCKG